MYINTFKKVKHNLKHGRLYLESAHSANNPNFGRHYFVGMQSYKSIMHRELKNALGPSFDNSSFDALACFHNNKLVITNDDLDPD